MVSRKNKKSKSNFQSSLEKHFFYETRELIYDIFAFPIQVKNLLNALDKKMFLKEFSLFSFFDLGVTWFGSHRVNIDHHKVMFNENKPAYCRTIGRSIVATEIFQERLPFGLIMCKRGRIFRNKKYCSEWTYMFRTFIRNILIIANRYSTFKDNPMECIKTVIIRVKDGEELNAISQSFIESDKNDTPSSEIKAVLNNSPINSIDDFLNLIPNPYPNEITFPSLSSTFSENEFKNRIQCGRAMISAFQSVGVPYFNVFMFEQKIYLDQTFKYISYGRQSADILLANLESYILTCLNKNMSLTIRPKLPSKKFMFCQLDDIQINSVNLLKKYCLFAIETSPNNYQVCLAIEGITASEKKELNRIIKFIFSADKGATGSYKLAGSINFKEKHFIKYGFYPPVNLLFTNPENIINCIEVDKVLKLNIKKELKPAKLLSLEEVKKIHLRNTTKKFPSYEAILRNGNKKYDQNGNFIGMNRSDADHCWSCACLKLGFSVKQIAFQLLKLSEKAKEKGKMALKYIAYIVRCAFKSLKMSFCNINYELGLR